MLRNLLQKISQRFGALGVPFLLLLAGLFMLLIGRGYILKGDAASFINNSHIVAPLYPFFLKIHAWIFGGCYLWAAAVSQLVLGFGAALWFADSLRNRLLLPSYLTAILSLILIVPYFTAMQFGNSILSESLAYPLLLITMRFFLAGLLDRQSSPLIAAFLWSIPLILTRRQFVVLYPLFALSLIYIHTLGPRFSRKAQLILTLMAVIGGTHLIERTCQYLRDGRFEPIPFSGFHLVTAPLFVSQPGNGALMADDTQRAIFDKTYARLKKRGLLYRSSLAGPDQLDLLPVECYYAGYNSICWQTLLPVLHEQGLQDWYRIDPVTRSMAWMLIRYNRGDYLKLLRLNVVRGAGGNFQLVFLILFLLLASGYHWRHRDGLSLVAVVISLLNLGSLFLIALAEPVRTRYITPTESLQICVYVIAAVQGWRSSRLAHFQ